MTQVVRKLKDWEDDGAQPGGYSQGGLLIALADPERFLKEKDAWCWRQLA